MARRDRGADDPAAAAAGWDRGVGDPSSGKLGWHDADPLSRASTVRRLPPELLADALAHPLRLRPPALPPVIRAALPRPFGGERRFRCDGCGSRFEADEAPIPCPVCGSAYVEDIGRLPCGFPLG